MSESIAAAAKLRVSNAAREIEASMAHIAARQPLAAEQDTDRAIRRVAEVTGVDDGTAAQIVEDPQRNLQDLGLRGWQLRKAEALQGKTVDYVGVAWLDAGRRAARSVARIVSRDGAPIGTGFLVSNRLLLTNHHVIESAAAAGDLLAEFGYEVELGKRAPQPVRFAFDPLAFFQTAPKDDLDFTLVAVGRCLQGNASLSDFGCCPLSDSAAKHSVGEPVNIVQHPDGDLKQVVFRENRIVHRRDRVLHYVADTEGGASGSPVFNDEWQVVALHHWGGPHLEQLDAQGKLLRQDVNEGIRVSAIIAQLRAAYPRMPALHQRLLDAALRAAPGGDFGTRTILPPVVRGPQRLIDTRRDARRGDYAHRTRVSMDAAAMDELQPGLLGEGGDDGPSGPSGPSDELIIGGAEAAKVDPNYKNRRGYNPNFLEGFPVPLPQLNARQRRQAARVRGAATPHHMS